MSFVRPEVAQLASRWAETAIMGGVAAIFLWQALVGVAVRHWIITVVLLSIAAVAGVLTWIAIQKARFRGVPANPGVVTVAEARVAYFGPDTGGVADLTALASVSIRMDRSGPVWVLDQPAEVPLVIPVAARGADRLPETFAVLPGFDIGRAAQALLAADEGEVAVWRRLH